MPILSLAIFALLACNGTPDNEPATFRLRTYHEESDCWSMDEYQRAGEVWEAYADTGMGSCRQADILVYAGIVDGPCVEIDGDYEAERCDVFGDTEFLQDCGARPECCTLAYEGHNCNCGEDCNQP